MRATYRQTLIPWLAGFFLLANVYLTPFAAQGPRATDALGAIFSLWLLWKFATTGVHTKSFAALVLIGSIPFTWGLYALSTDDAATALMSFRWLVAIPWAYALFSFAQDPRQRVNLVWGMWWACVANVFVLLIQFLGFTQLTQNIGLAAQDSSLTAIYELGGWSGVERAPGMSYHPNASAAVTSLIVPLSLYLYYARRAGSWVVLVAFGLAFIASQFTLTRSALLVTLVTALVVMLIFFASKRTMKLAALCILGGLPALAWVGPPGGWERWLDPYNIATNSSVRLLSNAESLRISLEHPVGLGLEESREALQSAGYAATHNAFLHVALVFGLLFAVALALLMFVLILRVFGGWQTSGVLEAVLALQVFGLSFWEEHFGNPEFIIVVSWLAATSVHSFASKPKAPRLKRSTPESRNPALSGSLTRR